MDVMDISAAIDLLLAGVVPERVSELKQTWGEEADRVRLQDGEGFLVQQVYGTIQVNELALKEIWFMGFVCWKAVQAYSGILWALQIAGAPFDPKALGQLHGQAEADDAFDLAMEQARNLGASATVSDFKWPGDIPFPAEENEFADQQQKAVFDLVCICCTYIFLHEIRHALLRTDSNSLDSFDEETECDAFARGMMLDKLQDYADKHQCSEHAVRAKRTIGIVFAKLVILAVTPRNKWSHSEDHPPVKDRLRSVLAAVKEPVPDWFWPTCAALSAAFARYYRLVETPLAFNSNRDLAFLLCDRFDAMSTGAA
jgi:Peptidase U49